MERKHAVPAKPPVASAADTLKKQKNLIYCRFCARKFKEKELINLSDPTDLKFWMKKLHYVGLKGNLKKNNLPKFICHPCGETLSNCEKFFEKFRNAQNYLQSLSKSESDGIATLTLPNIEIYAGMPSTSRVVQGCARVQGIPDSNVQVAAIDAYLPQPSAPTVAEAQSSGELVVKVEENTSDEEDDDDHNGDSNAGAGIHDRDSNHDRDGGAGDGAQGGRLGDVDQNDRDDGENRTSRVSSKRRQLQDLRHGRQRNASSNDVKKEDTTRKKRRLWPEINEENSKKQRDKPDVAKKGEIEIKEEYEACKIVEEFKQNKSASNRKRGRKSRKRTKSSKEAKKKKIDDNVIGSQEQNQSCENPDELIKKCVSELNVLGQYITDDNKNLQSKLQNVQDVGHLEAGNMNTKKNDNRPGQLQDALATKDTRSSLKQNGELYRAENAKEMLHSDDIRNPNPIIEGQVDFEIEHSGGETTLKDLSEVYTEITLRDDMFRAMHKKYILLEIHLTDQKYKIGDSQENIHNITSDTDLRHEDKEKTNKEPMEEDGVSIVTKMHQDNNSRNVLKSEEKHLSNTNQEKEEILGEQSVNIDTNGRSQQMKDVNRINMHNMEKHHLNNNESDSPVDSKQKKDRSQMPQNKNQVEENKDREIQEDLNSSLSFHLKLMEYFLRNGQCLPFESQQVNHFNEELIIDNIGKGADVQTRVAIKNRLRQMKKGLFAAIEVGCFRNRNLDSNKLSADLHRLIDEPEEYSDHLRMKNITFHSSSTDNKPGAGFKASPFSCPFLIRKVFLWRRLSYLKIKNATILPARCYYFVIQIKLHGKNNSGKNQTNLNSDNQTKSNESQNSDDLHKNLDQIEYMENAKLNISVGGLDQTAVAVVSSLPPTFDQERKLAESSMETQRYSKHSSKFLEQSGLNKTSNVLCPYLRKNLPPGLTINTIYVQDQNSPHDNGVESYVVVITHRDTCHTCDNVIHQEDENQSKVGSEHVGDENHAIRIAQQFKNNSEPSQLMTHTEPINLVSCISRSDTPQSTSDIPSIAASTNVAYQIKPTDEFSVGNNDLNVTSDLKKQTQKQKNSESLSSDTFQFNNARASNMQDEQEQKQNSGECIVSQASVSQNQISTQANAEDSENQPKINFMACVTTLKPSSHHIPNYKRIEKKTQLKANDIDNNIIPNMSTQQHSRAPLNNVRFEINENEGLQQRVNDINTENQFHRPNFGQPMEVIENPSDNCPKNRTNQHIENETNYLQIQENQVQSSQQNFNNNSSSRVDDIRNSSGEEDEEEEPRSNSVHDERSEIDENETSQTNRTMVIRELGYYLAKANELCLHVLNAPDTIRFNAYNNTLWHLLGTECRVSMPMNSMHNNDVNDSRCHSEDDDRQNTKLIIGERQNTNHVHEDRELQLQSSGNLPLPRQPKKDINSQSIFRQRAMQPNENTIADRSERPEEPKIGQISIDYQIRDCKLLDSYQSSKQIGRKPNHKYITYQVNGRFGVVGYNPNEYTLNEALWIDLASHREFGPDDSEINDNPVLVNVDRVQDLPITSRNGNKNVGKNPGHKIHQQIRERPTNYKSQIQDLQRISNIKSYYENNNNKRNNQEVSRKSTNSDEKQMSVSRAAQWSSNNNLADRFNGQTISRSLNDENELDERCMEALQARIKDLNTRFISNQGNRQESYPVQKSCHESVDKIHRARFNAIHNRDFHGFPCATSSEALNNKIQHESNPEELKQRVNSISNQSNQLNAQGSSRNHTNENQIGINRAHSSQIIINKKIDTQVTSQQIYEPGRPETQRNEMLQPCSNPTTPQQLFTTQVNSQQSSCYSVLVNEISENKGNRAEMNEAYNRNATCCPAHKSQPQVALNKNQLETRQKIVNSFINSEVETQLTSSRSVKDTSMNSPAMTGYRLMNINPKISQDPDRNENDNAKQEIRTQKNELQNTIVSQSNDNHRTLTSDSLCESSGITRQGKQTGYLLIQRKPNEILHNTGNRDFQTYDNPADRERAIVKAKADKWLVEEMEKSWHSYPWYCCYCRIPNLTLNDVRSHSMRAHGACYGFDCFTCYNNIEEFDSFVRHMRMHKPNLMFYCQYCNQRFISDVECHQHVNLHISAGFPCQRCGHIFLDQAKLHVHQRQYLKRSDVVLAPTVAFLPITRPLSPAENLTTQSSGDDNCAGRQLIVLR